VCVGSTQLRSPWGNLHAAHLGGRDNPKQALGMALLARVELTDAAYRIERDVRCVVISVIAGGRVGLEVDGGMRRS